MDLGTGADATLTTVVGRWSRWVARMSDRLPLTGAPASEASKNLTLHLKASHERIPRKSA
jgi:hypothetical protein